MFSTDRRLRRWAIASLVLPLIAVSAVAATLLGSGRVALLHDDDGAHWIIYPTAANTIALRAVPIAATFRRAVTLESQPSSARIRVRAFREVRLRVNGIDVPLSAQGASWTDERVAEVGPLLRNGRNVVEARVSNHLGPPAFWARLAVDHAVVATDESWEASLAGATTKPARRATRRPEPISTDLDGDHATAGTWPAGTWTLFVALAVAGFLAALLWRGLGLARRLARTSVWVGVLLVGVTWTLLFVHDAGILPIGVGFDAPDHLQYVRLLQERQQLPHASEGWQTYQPPLYYVLAAAAQSVASETATPASAGLPLKALGIAIAWVTLAAIALSLRDLFPGRARPQLLGMLVTGGIGSLLCLFQFPTNEILVIALSAVASLFTIRALQGEGRATREHVIAGLATGLALLSKLSAVLLVPPALVALCWRAQASPREDRRGRWVSVVLWAAAIVGVSGWFYVRAWIHSGSPLVTNVTLFPHWQQPGFHTAGDYLRFGRSVTHPLFAGFSGFWDSLYSTMWGDGLVGGSASASMLPWSRRALAVSYVFAILPTAAMVVGAVSFTRRWIRSPTPHAAFVVWLAATAFAAVVTWSLQVPFYSTKAFYAFVALVAVVVFAAEGVDVMLGSGRARAVIIGGLFAAWVMASVATYWLVPGDPTAAAAIATQWAAKGDRQRARELLAAAVRRNPTAWDPRIRLAEMMLAQGAEREAAALLDPDRQLPVSGARLRAVAALSLCRLDLTGARSALLASLQIDPDDLEALTRLATVDDALGDRERAKLSWQEVLTVDPVNNRAHRALARLLALDGNIDGAMEHAGYAERLR